MPRPKRSSRRRASRIEGGASASPWTGAQLRAEIPKEPDAERRKRRKAAARVRDGMGGPEGSKGSEHE
jgi:hypothetical protein